MENWKYKNKEIICLEDMQTFEPDVWGFVYIITLLNKRTGDMVHQYIGKKQVQSTTSKTATKKELKEFPKSHFRRKRNKDGSIKYYQSIVKESDWKDYCSSNDFIKLNKDKYKIIREIICFSTGDSDLTFKEAKEIICQGALESKFFLNNNVSIKRIIKNKE